MKAIQKAQRAQHKQRTTKIKLRRVRGFILIPYTARYMYITADRKVIRETSFIPLFLLVYLISGYWLVKSASYATVRSTITCK